MTRTSHRSVAVFFGDGIVAEEEHHSRASQQSPIVVPTTEAPLFCVLLAVVPSPPAQDTSFSEAVLPVHLPVTVAAGAASKGQWGELLPPSVLPHDIVLPPVRPPCLHPYSAKAILYDVVFLILSALYAKLYYATW